MFVFIKLPTINDHMIIINNLEISISKSQSDFQIVIIGIIMFKKHKVVK